MTAREGLALTEVSVAYGSTQAVNRVSLEVSRGATVAITGPSGCGKSSLLAAIAGIVPYGGSIAWQGEPLDGTPVHKRGVGLMFQDGQLFPHRSIARNVSFGLEMAGVERHEREAIVAELLDLVGLAGMGERATSELSGGERQRVALARALAPSPRVLLLDEPLSSLDSTLRSRLGLDIARVIAARGTTAVLVTHDIDEAKAIAHRVVRMDGGRLLDA